jgi:hypothetical protein
MESGGVSSQQLRYIDILMVSPWKIALGKDNGYPFTVTKEILVANPSTFMAQKILIHHERSYRDRAKDLLYLHDTVDVCSEHLEELREIYSKEVRPRLHGAPRVSELTQAGEGLYGKVNDTIREAALMATGRRLSAEALAETGRAGLNEIFK